MVPVLVLCNYFFETESNLLPLFGLKNYSTTSVGEVLCRKIRLRITYNNLKIKYRE